MRTVANIRFSPQQPSKLGNLRAYLKGLSRPTQYNWAPHKRTSVYNKSQPLNKVTLGNIFGYLHHLSSHSPDAVSAKWKRAAYRFEQHHMPFVDGRTTARWHNKVTAGGWM